MIIEKRRQIVKCVRLVGSLRQLAPSHVGCATRKAVTPARGATEHPQPARKWFQPET
jgi:hypothetical protein